MSISAEQLRRNFAEVKSGMKPWRLFKNRIGVCIAMMRLVYRLARQGSIFLRSLRKLRLEI